MPTNIPGVQQTLGARVFGTALKAVVLGSQRERAQLIPPSSGDCFLRGGGKSMGVQRATLVEGLGIEHHYCLAGKLGGGYDSIQIRTSKQKVITNPLYRPKVPQAAKMKEIRK